MITIGKIVNTHGIKGELRIISDFDKKEKIFKPGFTLYIGKNKEPHLIKMYRKHKNYDMVLFESITNINEVLEYKGQFVFIKREDLQLKTNEYLYQDLIGCKIIEEEKCLGIVNDLLSNKTGLILKIKAEKDFMIPFNNFFIKEVNIQIKEIKTTNAKELII